MAKKSIPIYGTTISFRAHPKVHSHLQRLSNMSNFINACLLAKLNKSKNKIEILRDSRKARIKTARKITRLTQTIEAIESQLTEEELEKMNSETETDLLKREIKQEELTDFLADE